MEYVYIILYSSSSSSVAFLTFSSSSKEDNLLEIIAKATSSSITIDSVNTLTKSDTKIYDLTILVENKEKLDKFCNTLNNLKFVTKVERQIN